MYLCYVSYACPFAHHPLVARKLKGLEEVTSVDVMDIFKGDKGWRFNPECPGSTADTVNGFFQCNKKCIRDYPNIWPYLRDLYQTPGFGETTNFMYIERHYQVYNNRLYYI